VSINQLASFTVDVSPRGFCVELMGRVLRPSSVVEGTIQVGERMLPFAGLVAWARQGDWNVRGKMGIRFTKVPHEFADLAKLTPGAR
jgi:hypothetical protein